MPKSAKELMAELGNDKEYQARRSKNYQRFAELNKFYAEDEKDLVSEINKIGFSIDSVWDFVNSANNYLDAVPILIKHLNIKHHPKITSGIVRSLAIPELSDDNVLWDYLEKLYLSTESDAEINDPFERGLQESIAVALEALSTPSKVAQLKNIISIRPNGDGVNWLKSKMKLYEQKSI
jgi:hypothetical protein